MKGVSAFVAMTLLAAGTLLAAADNEPGWRGRPALEQHVRAATRSFFGKATGLYVTRLEFGPQAGAGPELALWEQFISVVEGVPQAPPDVAGALAIAGCIAHNCPAAHAAAILSSDGTVMKAAILTYYARGEREPQGVVFFASRHDFDPALEELLTRWAHEQRYYQLDAARMNEPATLTTRVRLLRSGTSAQ